VEDSVTLTRLVQWYEASEQASQRGRREGEQARDYYDGKQLTPEERKVLRKRRQPETVANRIQRKVDYLRGLERQGRTDPKAVPRTPQDESDADACTDALRYAKEVTQLDIKRSQVFENMMIEGFGGVEVGVVKCPGGYVDPKITLLPWDRLFYDPHSAAHDFSDARYVGFINWLDVEDAKARPEWKDKGSIIDSTMNQPYSSFATTYDDKPRWSSWYDPTRKRIRVVTMYHRDAGVWMRSEFTVAGYLSGPVKSPFVDEHGEPECAIVLQSAYVDRENDRYGIVRSMISPQDELNKRRSKSLHLLTSRQVRVSRNVEDLDAVRREIAKPDGVIQADTGEIEVLTNMEFVQGQFQLMQEAKAELDGMGPNATLQGKGGEDQSGRAILALQQGGMVEMTPLLDNLRHFSLRVYRMLWNRIRQYWTQERWVRVTTEDAVTFVGLNTTRGAIAMQKIGAAVKAGEIDPATAQQYAMQVQQNPAMSQPANQVGQLDVDIEIDEMNETPTLQYEQFQTLTQLAQSGVPIPPEVIIAASTLRDKAKLLKMLSDAKATPDPQAQLKTAALAASIQATTAGAQLSQAKAGRENVLAQADALSLHSAPVGVPALPATPGM